MRLHPLPRILILLTTSWLASHPAAPASETEGSLRPANLRCEYAVNPLGIGEQSPRLSWIGESTRRGERQSAYQVLVASTIDLLARDTGDRWDSGKVASDESAHVAYAGQPLKSRAGCFWKIRLWDRDGQPSPWSAPATWTMGLLEPADWQAKFIDGLDARPRPLAIRRAIYESVDGKKSADVTATLAALAQAGRQDFGRVDSALVGIDPSEGHPKRLRVDYEIAGQTGSMVVPEGAPLKFERIDERPFCLRKSFAVDGPVASATLYVTALGLYECRLNGARVGDHALAPDWTDYNKRLVYQAYDVTPLVQAGDNALSALVADGWYAGHLGNGGFRQYGRVPALLAQLEITRADGHTERIVSDGTWKSHDSAILSSDFMLGESYDARLETPGWDRPGFDDRDWPPVRAREEPPRALDARVAPPVRQLAERAPIARTEPAPGQWTYDLGQNLVGVVRLKVRAPAGTKVTLRHAEMLNADGTLYTANLRSASSVDTYVCRGGGEVETWQPRFTFHGFRYVELSGLPGSPEAGAVTGVVLGSDTPVAGTWTCSNPALNQLMSNIEWGRRGNFLSVPTDCPQRDERLGWMGDAQVFARTSTDLADVAAFFTKWLVDVDDAQTPAGGFTDVAPRRASGVGTPGWGDAGVICPWTMYEAYGDRRILERHLPAMTRWVEWCRVHSTNLLRDKDRGGDFGDWLAIGANTPKEVIGTAYFAYSTHLLAKSCRALDRSDEAEKYERLFEEIRAAFNRAYVAPDGRIKGDTQCAYAMALKFELLPEDLRPKAVQYLADDIAARGNHLTTGFVGVSYLLPSLTAGGRLDTAYALLTQDTFPSWLFSVKQGATTIWERWDGWTPGKGFQDARMNSFNHYSLGSCGEWLYDTVAGIGGDPEAPGYRRLVLRPRPGGGLAFVRATRRTVYGEVTAAWKTADGEFRFDVTVPANTTARVILPTPATAGVTESGKPVTESGDIKVLAPTEGDTTLEVGSGNYHFTCPPATKRED